MTATADTLNHCDVERRQDFVLLFEVQDGNPNGDPDAGNMPRMDPETTQGIVTDVALKRKVRDYVDATGLEQSRFKIYIQRETYLTETRKRVWEENAEGRQGIRPAEHQKWMCRQFYDIRMFGAVMGMKNYNAGQVRGPLQMTFARSIDRIMPQDSSITRVALEHGRQARQGELDELAAPTHGTMGRKATIPYGLYRAHGFFNPHFARRTGADAADLELFWTALVNMWDFDRSSSRGFTACRGLYVFSHQIPLGNAPAHRLFDLVKVDRKEETDTPRSFSDYKVSIDENALPDRVTLTRLEG